MDYPTVRYRTTSIANYLELDSWEGVTCGVVFDDAAMAARAMKPGRAEFDCSAILNGFLPLGARRVSRARPSEDINRSDAHAAVTIWRRAKESCEITPESDHRARRRNPRDSRIYDSFCAQAIANDERKH